MSQTEIPKRTIDFRVTIDATSLPHPQDDPGAAAEPTSIAQEQGYIVVTASREIMSQGAGDIAFAADVGDTLRFFISSGSNNFEQPVLLEDIRHTEGDEILGDCAIQVVEREAIAPDSDALSTHLFTRQFEFFECTVGGDGTGSYDLIFALYDQDEDAQPRLVSHYRWALRLTKS